VNLNQQQFQQFQTWLTTHGIPGKCPACGGSRYSPPDFVALLAIDPARYIVQTSTGTPHVQLICDNCGHVRLFSATKAGLMAKRSSDSAGPAP
jgi:hypothetical protein